MTVPKGLRIAGAIALLWNLLGCVAFAMDLMITPDDLQRMDAAQRALYEARPMWSVIATGVAVGAGALGSLALMLGRRWALALLVASLAGVVVQDIGMAIVARDLVEPAAVVLQALVLVVAIGLVWLARRGVARGWLR